MNKQIYLIVTLQIVISERTIFTPSLHIIEVDKKSTDSEIEKELHKKSLEVAKGYSDDLDDNDEDSETFSFNCEEMTTEVFSVKRLTKKELDVLKIYL